MTASVLEAHRKASIAAGMDGFASKPVDWFALSHEIARVLGLQPVGALAATQKAATAQVLNRAAGTQRWGGSADEHQLALCRFDADHAHSMDDLAALHDCGDAAGLQAQAHRVRGVAANLGLEQLAATLADIEKQAGELARLANPAAGPDGRPALPALAALLARYAGELQQALEAVRAQPCPVRVPVPSAAPVAAFDAVAVREAGAALQHSLTRGALDDAALVRLARVLHGHVPPAALAPVQMAIDDFDFTLAETRLATLLDTVLHTDTETTS
jgi:HPt (histidine-containing phosphotransfer) domain-containing protein